MIAIVLVRLFVIPQNAMLAFYSEPVILEFAAGMGLAVLYIRGVKINGALIWALTAIVMIFLLFGWLILSDVEIDRVFYFGVPAALLMACFTLPKGASKVPIGLVWSRLGDSSYALYLSHVFVIAAMGVLFRYFAASDWQQYTGLCVVFVIVSVISSCIAGWGLHILVERPFGRMLASKRNHFNLTEPKQSAISR